MTATSTRPPYPDLIVDNLPSDLTDRRQWVGWSWGMRDGAWSKIPKNPTTGNNASTSDPATWGSFAAALAYATRRGCGIGYVFCADDPFVGVDFDHVVDPETGEISPAALERIHALNSYTDLSPRDGVKVIVRATKPGTRCVNRSANIEMYEDRRLFTLTGRHLAGTPATIEPRQVQLVALYRDLFGDATPAPAAPRTAPALTLADEDIIAAAERINTKFSRLWSGSIDGYPSHSEARSALVYVLAGYTKDPAQLDRLFMASGLYREDKWPRERDRLIGDALRDVTWQYEPTPKTAPPAPTSPARAADSDDAGEACGAERAEIGELRRLLAEKDATIATLEAERDEAIARHAAVMAIINNPSFTPAEAVATVRACFEYERLVALGRTTDRTATLYLGELAKGQWIDRETGARLTKEPKKPEEKKRAKLQASMAPATISRALKTVAERTGAFTISEKTDPKTGKTRLTMTAPSEPTIATLQTIGHTFVTIDRSRGPGRSKPRDPRLAAVDPCQTCGDVDILVKADAYCTGCGQHLGRLPDETIPATTDETEGSFQIETDGSDTPIEEGVAPNVPKGPKLKRSHPHRSQPRRSVPIQVETRYVPQEPAGFWDAPLVAAMED